jgi:hypothetical protein
MTSGQLCLEQQGPLLGSPHVLDWDCSQHSIRPDLDSVPVMAGGPGQMYLLLLLCFLWTQPYSSLPVLGQSRKLDLSSYGGQWPPGTHGRKGMELTPGWALALPCSSFFFPFTGNVLKVPALELPFTLDHSIGPVLTPCCQTR